MPKLNEYLLLQLLHRADRLVRLLEAALDVTHVVVDLADAVDRDARAEDDAALVAHLDDLGQHRNGTVGRQPGGVDAQLPQSREFIDHHAADFDQVVPGRGLAARDVRVLDVLPQARAEDFLDLGERHVRLAIAALPVVAHLAAGVADERAMENDDRRMDGLRSRDVAVDEVPRYARGRLRQVPQRVDLCHKPFIIRAFSATTKLCGRPDPGLRSPLSLLLAPTHSAREVEQRPGQVGDDAREDDERRKREAVGLGYPSRL